MRTTATRCIITTVVLALAGTSEAKPPEASPATSSEKATTAKPAKASKPPAVDPRVVTALKRMGAYLREQQHFTVLTKSETDYILDTGQKATLGAEGELRVQRPGKLHARVTSDRKQREYISDGKTFTIFSPNLGLYATAPAPGTLGELADKLTTEYGLQLPLVDLFRWGTGEADFDLLTHARYIDIAKIDGVDVDHFALRQPGVDWQIWIQRGERPVPRKLMLTTTDDPARPEHTLELAWDLGAKHPDEAFTFVAPKDSSKIAMVDLQTKRAQEQQARRPTRSTRGGAK